MDIQEIRRGNLRAMMDKEGATDLAKKLGYRTPTFLSQMCGPNPTRKVTEKSARRFEKDLGIPAGTLDKDPATAAKQATPSTIDVDLVADVIRMVGNVCSAEAVELPPSRFADLVALAFVDTIEHQGKQRPEHVKQLVRLFK